MATASVGREGEERVSVSYIGAAAAARLDEELMSPGGGFLLPQLMELAGLSVASALHDAYPPSENPGALVLAGPGNNGGR